MFLVTATSQTARRTGNTVESLSHLSAHRRTKRLFVRLGRKDQRMTLRELATASAPRSHARERNADFQRRGTEPVWIPNGRELFYRSGNTVMTVDVTTKSASACPVARAGGALTLLPSERAARVSHASGAGIEGVPASARVGESEGRSPSVKESAPGRIRTCDPLASGAERLKDQPRAAFSAARFKRSTRSGHRASPRILDSSGSFFAMKR